MSKLKILLLDILGINKYAVHWDYTADGFRFQGSYDGRKGLFGPMSRFHAYCLARSMNKDYGKGTHWTERAPQGKADEQG